MIFTIGDKSLYEAYLSEDPNAAKAAGGTVWLFREQAEAHALLINVTRPEKYRFKVYGVMAVWDEDTKPDPEVGNGAHTILRDAKLIPLEPNFAEAEDISETLEEQIGATIARVFKLRRDPEHKDRWQTTAGSKTNLGVFRTVVGIIRDHKHYGQGTD